MKQVLLLLTFFCISSCSFAEVIYKNLDWYMVWQVNRIIDLDAEQERYVERAAENYMSWHRVEELPLYRDLLIRIRNMAADSLTAVELDSAYTAIKERVQVLMESASDETADLLVTLTPEQIDGMEKNMEKMNRRFDKQEDEDGSKQRKKRVDRIQERVEDWVGALSPEQEKWLISYAMQMPTSTDYWLEHRRWRQKQLLDILRGKNGEDEKKSAIRSWVVRQDFGKSENYVRAERTAQEATIRFIVEIDRRLTSLQRQYLLEKLAKYIRIAEDLTRKS
jgi:hypothetical protein